MIFLKKGGLFLRTIIIEPDRTSLENLVAQLKQRSDVDIIETYTTIFDDVHDFLNEEIDVVFIDYFLSDKYNMDFVVQLVLQYPSIQIVLMKSDAQQLEESKISEIQFLSKPIQQASLEKVMEKMHDKRNKMTEQVNSFHKTEHIIKTRQLIAEKNKEKMESIFLKIIKN